MIFVYSFRFPASIAKKTDRPGFNLACDDLDRTHLFYNLFKVQLPTSLPPKTTKEGVRSGLWAAATSMTIEVTQVEIIQRLSKRKYLVTAST